MKNYYRKRPREVGQINLSVADKDNNISLSVKKKVDDALVGHYEKIKLNTMKYKGFMYIEKLDDEMAVVSNSEHKLAVFGDFSRLKSKVRYLISDLIKNRNEVL